jgi:hypothetical protein
LAFARREDNNAKSLSSIMVLVVVAVSDIVLEVRS